MFSASFFLQTRSVNVVWVHNLFYLAFFNSLSFSVFFSVFSNDNIFAIRCKWQMSKSCLCFFLALIFCAFVVKFGLRPFLHPFGPEPNSVVGETDMQSELSGSLGRERLAQPWLCSPAIPLPSPSLGSFCSLINLFFAVSLRFFAFFTYCEPGPRLGTCIFS